MLGNSNDMLRRIKTVLPQQWFPDTTPILDGLLTGLARAWALTYSLLGYVRLQTRIATATDVLLDIIAVDFFGGRIVRGPGQSDNAFRVRILLEVLRERDTRAALINVLAELTGREPVVFEPARATDTGGWGIALAYGAAGGWGSLSLPYQCFVTAFRPVSGGIANVGGYAAEATPPSFAPGAVTARQFTATYLDQNGQMQIAGPGEVRPSYRGGELVGLLVESESTNLLPSSMAFGSGWASWGSIPPVASTDIPPPLAGATVIKFSAGADTNGGYWSLQSLSANTDYASSVWVYLPAGFSAATCFIDANNGGTTNEQQNQVPQTLTAQWQRIAVIFNTPQNGGAAYTGFEVGGSNLPAYIALWQFEQRAAPSSYIPTTTGAATRDADVLSNALPDAGGYGFGAVEYADLDMVQAQLGDADIDAAIAETMPVATIAWTRISN